MIYIFFILILILLFLNIYIQRKSKLDEHFSFNNETFYSFLEDIKNIEILDVKKFIKVGNKNLTGHIGQNIYFNFYNKLNKKYYILIRYPDFMNEILRHSEKNFKKYFSNLSKIINLKKNYIFDFTSFHGIIDNKVRLYLSLRNYYSKSLADEIMGKTYLIPNDLKIFLKNYNRNKKYILKNSFGGARSALTITKSKDEILSYFNQNSRINFYPDRCEDSVCHRKVKYNIVQDYIDNLYRLNDYKVGLRLYFVIICENGVPNGYLYKDGLVHYSLKKYNETNDIASNVVGSIFKVENIIKDNNLPYNLIGLKRYIIENEINGEEKFNFFIKILLKYFNYILKANSDKLCIFNNYKNIEKFAVYGVDIEFDNDFKPYIFEGNFYFARFKQNNKYGKIVKKLYNDIFFKLKLTTMEYNSFWKV